MSFRLPLKRTTSYLSDDVGGDDDMSIVASSSYQGSEMSLSQSSMTIGASASQIGSQPETIKKTNSSPVWDFFKKITWDNESKTAGCNLCTTVERYLYAAIKWYEWFVMPGAS